jgi:hypothetical protein
MTTCTAPTDVTSWPALESRFQFQNKLPTHLINNSLVTSCMYVCVCIYVG